MPYLNGVFFGNPTFLFLGLLSLGVVPVVIGRASSGIRFLLPNEGVSAVRGHKRCFAIGGTAAKSALFVVVREHRRRTALPSCRRHIARYSINDDRQFRHVAAVANKTKNGRVQACVQQFTMNVLPEEKNKRERKEFLTKNNIWSTNKQKPQPPNSKKSSENRRHRPTLPNCTTNTALFRSFFGLLPSQSYFTQ